jgi:membrane protein HdeD
MNNGKNVLLGVLAIILGLIVIAFPLISVFTFSVMAGLGVLFLGIWFVVQTSAIWEKSKAYSIVYFILGIFAIITGIGLIGNIVAFSYLASFVLYIAGFLVIISGILTIFSGEGTSSVGMGFLGIIMGVLYILLGSYVWNPYFLAILIGFWLIISGIFQFFAKDLEVVPK